MGEVKQIYIKNRTYYFLQRHDQSQNFCAKLAKNIGIYNIGYLTIKKIDDYSVNPLYF